MSYALLGVILVVALVALIAIFMSNKNWHWGHVLLVLGVFLFGITAMFLSAEVLRIQAVLRSKINADQEQLAGVEAQNEALRTGTDDMALANRIFAGAEQSPLAEGAERMPGIGELNHQLQVAARRQGRTWNGVSPASGLQNGQIAVSIPEGQPPLPQGSIVYAFEMGPPQGADSQQGAQYLGEFSVADSQGNRATLAPADTLTERTGRRLATSQGPWRIYETMPADRHELFTDLSEERLRSLLPAESVEEYLRHGGPATPDDDRYHIAGFDEEGRRVPPDQVGEAAETRYNRALRAYGYLFEELARQRVLLLADIRTAQSDTKRLQQAHENAKKLTAYRNQEIEQLTKDRKLMQRDLNVITDYLAKVNKQLENARQLVSEGLAANEQLAEQLAQRQLGSLEARGRVQSRNNVFLTSP